MEEIMVVLFLPVSQDMEGMVPMIGLREGVAFVEFQLTDVGRY
jgi:hypothetical protein